MDLAEIDDLVAALWQVRSRTDEYDGDLALTESLVGEGQEIASVLRSIGEDCFQAGTRLRHHADQLQSFRLASTARSSAGFHANAVGDDHWRRSADTRTPFSANDEVDLQLNRGLADLGVSPAEAAEIVAAFADRDSWVDISDIDVDLTDPAAFDPFSLAIMVLAFSDLVQANKDVREHVFGPRGRPTPGRSRGSRPGPPASQDLLSENDLIRIAENPETTGHLASIAMFLLRDRGFLAALDGAGQRRGDILGAGKIAGTDHVFSRDDLDKLAQQRSIALGLGPVRDEIDALGGHIDGTRSKHDFEAFAEQIRKTNPAVAELADQVIEGGYFDRGGWDTAADWAGTAGVALGALAFAMAVVGTGGTVIPAVMAVGAVGAGAVEFTAGVKTGELGHAVGGAFGVLGGAAGLRAVFGLRAGLLGTAGGLGDEALNTLDGVDRVDDLLRAGAEVPKFSVSEIDDLVGGIGLSADEIGEIFGGGVRAAAGSAERYAPRLESIIHEAVTAKLRQPVAALANWGGLDTAVRAVAATDSLLMNGTSPATGLIGGRLQDKIDARRRDDGGDTSRTRPPIPRASEAPMVTAVAATLPARAATTGTAPADSSTARPAPSRTPQPKKDESSPSEPVPGSELPAPPNPEPRPHRLAEPVPG